MRQTGIFQKVRRMAAGIFALAMLAGLLPVSTMAEGSTTTSRQTVSAGYEHFGAIDANGSLWMWGSNGSGELGNGGIGDIKDEYDWPYQTTPVKVLDNVVSLSTSKRILGSGGPYRASAAVKSDGTLWTWGESSMIGNGNVSNAIFSISEDWNIDIQNKPVQILDNVFDVYMGTSCSAALKNDHTLWAWGDWESGSDTNHDTPVQVMDDVISASVGVTAIAAIKSDHSLWMFGKDYSWNNTNLNVTATPTKIMDNVKTISLNADGSSAAGVFMGIIKEDNSLWVIGDAESEGIPKKVMDDAVAVSMGVAYGAAIKSDGSLWELGTDGYYYAKVFDTSLNKKLLDNVLEVSCGAGINIAKKSDGTIWTWGYDDFANTDAKHETPVQVKNLKGGTTVSASLPASTGNTASVTAETPATPPKSGFPDVPDSSPFADAVGWAVNQSITKGTSDTTFSPSDTCTHNHILTFIWRSQGSPVSSGDDDFSKAINWAISNGSADVGIIGNTPCTRADAVMYLWRLAGSPSASGVSFSDVPADAPYAQAVAWAVSKGITNGTSETTFSPDATCTRGQIVTFLYRAFA